MRSVKHLLSLKAGQLFWIVYYEVSKLRLCGQPPLWVSLIFSSCFVFVLIKQLAECQPIFGGILQLWISLIFCSCFVSVLSKQLAECQPIFGSISPLHAEMNQCFAIQWHQFVPLESLFVSLICNISKTGNIYTHLACFPCALADWMLNGERPMNEPLTCKFFFGCVLIKA